MPRHCCDRRSCAGSSGPKSQSASSRRPPCTCSMRWREMSPICSAERVSATFRWITRATSDTCSAVAAVCRWNAAMESASDARRSGTSGSMRLHSLCRSAPTASARSSSSWRSASSRSIRLSSSKPYSTRSIISSVKVLNELASGMDPAAVIFMLKTNTRRYFSVTRISSM